MNSERPTKAQRELVRSLAKPAGRREHGLFAVEGTKGVADTIGHFDCTLLVARPAWIETHSAIAAKAVTVLTANTADLERMSALSTPPDVIAAYRQPERTLDPESLKGQLTVALDRVQDPGNLGTIMRLCDWMGVRTILASADTVDVYNPKVVQATMGSIARVAVHYVDLPQVLGALADSGLAVAGTFMHGESVYTAPLPPAGVLVMGNEGQGISAEVADTVTRRLTIPRAPGAGAESLNVAIATAICLAEWNRKIRD